jgi:hypothetical protein
VRKLAVAVAIVLLLVGIPVAVASALAEATGSALALMSGAIVTMSGSFFLLLSQEMDGGEVAAVGVGLAVVGTLWALLGSDVIAVGPMSGVKPWAVAGLIIAIAGLALAVLGVRRLVR